MENAPFAPMDKHHNTWTFPFHKMSKQVLCPIKNNSSNHALASKFQGGQWILNQLVRVSHRLFSTIQLYPKH